MTGSVLLVHGAWHGAWCWEAVQQHLPGTVALDLPSNHIAVAFYGDCAEQPVDRLVPHALAASGEPTGPAPAWRSVPSTYVVCTLDQAIHADQQRFFAARCTSIVELEASHSPMLSMPGRVSEIAEACHTR